MVAAALLAGCGDDDESGAGEPSAAATELRIELDRDGAGGEAAESAAVSCDGAGGDEACAPVGDLPPDPAAPVPPDTACTELYGGPDLLTITGTLEGEAIDAEFTRENGCEIERFDRWVPLLRELFPGYRPGEAIAP
jgi:hypothetical protein